MGGAVVEVLVLSPRIADGKGIRTLNAKERLAYVHAKYRMFADQRDQRDDQRWYNAMEPIESMQGADEERRACRDSRDCKLRDERDDSAAESWAKAN